MQANLNRPSESAEGKSRRKPESELEPRHVVRGLQIPSRKLVGKDRVLEVGPLGSASHAMVPQRKQRHLNDTLGK